MGKITLRFVTRLPRGGNMNSLLKFDKTSSCLDKDCCLKTPSEAILPRNEYSRGQL